LTVVSGRLREGHWPPPSRRERVRSENLFKRHLKATKSGQKNSRRAALQLD
jgi:hypothetical protein